VADSRYSGLAATVSNLFAHHHLINVLVVGEECAGLPPHLTGPVCLALGLNLPVRVDPLRVDDEGITAGLSFNRRAGEVFVPWTALIAVRDASQERVLLSGPASSRTFSQKAAAVSESRTSRAASAPGEVIRVDFVRRRRVSG
jgi:hypothetical protein